MDIPGYRELMNPACRILELNGGELPFADLLDEIARDLKLADETRLATLATGSETIFANNVRWAVAYLAAQGQVSINGNTDTIEMISRQASYSGLAEAQSDFLPIATQPQIDEDLREGFRLANRRLKDSLLAYVLTREPEFFEELAIDLLLAMGYGGTRADMSRRLGRSRDGGVDGVIFQDELGLDFFYLQAKRYKQSSTVSISEVRDFAGSLEAHKAPKGVFITTGFLPHSAQKFVEAIPRRITLIDGNTLADLMIRHNIGVHPEPLLQLKAIDASYFTV